MSIKDKVLHPWNSIWNWVEAPTNLIKSGNYPRVTRDRASFKSAVRFSVVAFFASFTTILLIMSFAFAAAWIQDNHADIFLQTLGIFAGMVLISIFIYALIPFHPDKEK